MGWRNLPTLRVGWRKYRNLFLFLINTLLLYPLSYPLHTDRLTDGQTDGGTNTLASRGLEEPAHALRGLEFVLGQLETKTNTEFSFFF